MIWVIGSNGMLGSEICKQLEKNKMPFIGSDKEVDITKSECIEKFIRETESQEYLKANTTKTNINKIKWIINCAAYTAVEKAEEDQELAYQLNSIGPKNIANIARYNGIKLIHISTDYVFGGIGETPFTEDMKKNPLGVYGKSKSEGEENIQNLMTKYYIIRTAWLYGFKHPNFVYTMINLLNSKEQIKVVNDQFGTPTNASDLATAIIKLIEKANKNDENFDTKSIIPYGIYHFTNIGQISWFEFAQKIYNLGIKYKRITNKCEILPCTTEEFGAKVERPKYSVLNKNKIIDTLKIKIQSWDKSLEKFIKDKNF